MHCVDEAFPGAPLMPADPLARAKVRMMAKLMDEYVHTACMTLTFATANRAHLARMTPDALAAELAKAPDPKRSEIKRQAATARPSALFLDRLFAAGSTGRTP